MHIRDRFVGRHARWPYWAFLLLVLATVVLFARAAAAGGRDTVLAEGKDDFAENCTACQGADATGTGTLAAKLVKAPKDLTLIAQANGGVFPFWRTFEIVAGEKKVEGHDTHQMPEFLSQMRSEERRPGFAPRTSASSS